MIAIKAVHLLILCQVILQVNAATTWKTITTKATTANTTAATTVCPMFLRVCQAGCWYDLDSNGCSVCECPKKCEYTSCGQGQTCAMKAVNCTKKHCDLQPTCVPDEATTVKTTTTKSSEPIYKPRTCPRKVFCTKPCEADLGPDGCYSKCSCPKTCKNKHCKADEVCKLVQVYCSRAPCFRVPTCLTRNIHTKPAAKRTPCPAVCARFCKYGFEKDNKGCDNCSCYQLDD